MAIVQSRVAAVQAIYAAYYNRPADVGGLDFWTNQLQAANGNLTTIINAFGNSAEANALYTGSVENKVNQVYLALFNRPAEVAGLNFYVAEINAGRISLAGAAQAIAAGAQGADKTAFDNKVAASTLFTNGLDTAPEVLAYSQNGAAELGRAFLATVTATAPATQALVDAAIIALETGSVFNLTAGTDVASANIFNSGLVQNASDRVNALQDEDVLTGTGPNPELNVTLGNANDNGGTSITPVLNNITIINAAFTGNNSGGNQGNAAVSRLDLQDSTPSLAEVNVTRITDPSNNVQIDNMTNVAANLSLTNTSSPTAVVGFNFVQGAAAGLADTTTLTLTRVTVAGMSVEQSDGVAGANLNAVGLSDGVETINLVSAGTTQNTVGQFSAEDLRTLTITGTAGLKLGTTANTVGAQGVEATRYGAGLGNVAGSLTSVNAAALAGALDYTIGNEINAGLDDTSGNPVNLTVTGGAAADTFRLATGASIQAGDRIVGGAGNNLLQLLGNNTVATAAGNTATVTGVQTLDVRTGHDAGVAADTVTVDARAIADLNSVTIRNEGQDAAGAAFNSAAEAMTVNLSNVNAATADALTILHGTTGNSAIANNVVNVTSTVAGVTTAGVTIADGINNDPQFNLNLTLDTDGVAGNLVNTIANVNIRDNDTELNTVRLTEFAQHTGTLTITGTSANFLNLDASVNAYRYATNGTANNGTEGAPGVRTDSTGIAGAERLQFTTINSEAYAGNVILRVGRDNAATGNGSQNIRFGVGNDTVIFDTQSNNPTDAGLNLADTVSGGAGNDVLAIDGERNVAGSGITIRTSELEKVTGMEVLRFVGNQVGAGLTTGTANSGVALNTTNTNSYNLELSDSYLTNNANGGRVLTIINDNDSRNDDGIISAAEVTTETAFETAQGGANQAVSANTGITIDARALSAGFGINYNGEETSVANGTIEARAITNDRFIFVERNLNNTSVIDGGRLFLASTVVNGTATLTVDPNNANTIGNADILEVRNNAQVTLTDLSGISNVGNIEFTNDTNSVQTSELALDNATVNRMVNTASDALAANVTRTETLNIRAVDGVVAGSVTVLRMDTNGLTDSELRLNVTAGAGSDFLSGGAGADTIVAGDGNDTVTAGAGNDSITLGNGTDTLVFNSLTGLDTIADYVVADDSIQLSRTAFTTLGPVGALAAAEFESGAGLVNAVNATTRLIYNTATGDLYYDADGSAAASSAQLIGKFTGNPVLVAGEFSIIA